MPETVGVNDDDEVGESLSDCVCVGVNVGVIELLEVIDALAPRVTLVVGVAVFDDVTDALALAVSLETGEKLACAVNSDDILASILIGAAAETLVLIVDEIESDELALSLIVARFDALPLIVARFDALLLIVAPIDPGSDALVLPLNVMRPLTLIL